MKRAAMISGGNGGGLAGGAHLGDRQVHFSFRIPQDPHRITGPLSLRALPSESLR